MNTHPILVSPSILRIIQQHCFLILFFKLVSSEILGFYASLHTPCLPHSFNRNVPWSRDLISHGQFLGLSPPEQIYWVFNKSTYLSQWSSTSTCIKKHPEGLLKHRSLYPTQVYDLAVLRLGLRIQFSNMLLSHAGIRN